MKTELKTLEDLKDKHGIFGFEYVMIDKLKAEAIKWIKQFRKIPADYFEREEWKKETKPFKDLDVSIDSEYNDASLDDAFKAFFNITDEELK